MKILGFVMYKSGLCLFSVGNTPNDAVLFGEFGKEAPIALGRAYILNAKTDSLKTIVLNGRVVAKHKKARHFYAGWRRRHRECGLRPILQQYTRSGRKLLILPFQAVLESSLVNEDRSYQIQCVSTSKLTEILQGV